MMLLTIESYKIIILVNYAWDLSFGPILNNKKTISDRGQELLNHALLLNTTIRASMTNQYLEEERSVGVVVPHNITTSLLTAMVPYFNPPNTTNDPTPLPPLFEANTSIVPYTYPTTPVFNPFLVASPSNPDELLNYTQGTSAFCLESIMRMDDLMVAMKNIKAKQTEGKTLEEQLQESKKVTTGRCFKSETCQLGMIVFDVVKENKAKSNVWSTLT